MPILHSVRRIINWRPGRRIEGYFVNVNLNLLLNLDHLFYICLDVCPQGNLEGGYSRA